MINKQVLFITGTIVTAAVLAGCGRGSSSDGSSARAYPEESVAMAYDYADEGAYDYAGEEVYDGDLYDYDAAAAMPEAKTTDSASGSNGVSDPELTTGSSRKLIRTVNLSAETREFDKFIANITSKIDSLGGYVESSDINGNSYDTYSTRSAYIVARIPENKLDGFVTGVEEASNITNKNERAEDVTLQYADVEAHRDSLKIEQARLNELLEQADTLENIIELENRLAEVRYEIESYESRLRLMSNQVQFSTVNLDVYEVKEYTPEPVVELSFGQRLYAEFTDSCKTAWETIQDFVIGFIAFIPLLLVILVILFVIFIIVFAIVKAIIAIVRSSRRKKAAKKAAAPVPTTQPVKAAPAAEDEGKADR